MIRATILVFFLTASVMALRADTFAVLAQRVEPSVCRVEAGLAGTGFLIERSDTVVTALHVVAGARQITVTCASASPKPYMTRKAKISKVLREDDLALLTLDQPTNLKPFKMAQTRPTKGEPLLVLGYSLNTEYVQPRPVEAALLRDRLRELVDQVTSLQLQAIGINVDQAVVHINGPLVPGLSGAPVLNQAGEVVAVGDGGLERGAASISWAIPVASVGKLLQSHEDLKLTATQASRALFSAEPTHRISEQVIQGSLNLVCVRSRTLAELAPGSDDKFVLDFLIAPVKRLLPDFDARKLSFDIYQDVASGALATVPTGMIVSQRGNYVSAKTKDGKLELKVELIKVPRAADVQSASEAIEQHAVDDPSTISEWYQDPGWTMPMPTVRDDGVVYRRKGYTHVRFGEPLEYLWETFAARGNVLVAATAYSRENPATMANEPARLTDWLRILLAAHLTTFAK